MNERELAVSVNIVLGEDVSESLNKIQRLLQKDINERRKYDSSPHLAICTKFMPKKMVPDFLEAINESFSDLRMFEIFFSGFAPSETGNYIFLNFKKETRNYIFELNQKVKDSTKGIGFESPGGLPPKYPYDPHISIIKLLSAQVNKGISLLNNQFDFKKMKVSSLEVTVESRDENDFATFPAELSIDLK